MERIGRPILGAQIFALVVNLVAVAGFVTWEAAHGLDWLSWFGATGQSRGGGAFLAAAFSGWGLMVTVPALATLVVLGGAAVYLAAERQ